MSAAPLLLLGGAALLLMGGKKKKKGSRKNFYDFSDVGPSSSIIFIMNEMTEMASGDRMLLGVVTDKSDVGRTDHVREILKWGASKRPDMNFALIDCALETNPDCPNTAWNWAVGNPSAEPLNEGRIESVSSFSNVVQEIVER